MGGMDGDAKQIQLSEVLESIEHGKLKVRAEAVQDLRTLFDPNRPANNISNLRDKAYHKIYEVLFVAVRAEKASFLSAKTTTTTATAIQRLTACADVLRIVVKAGASKIKLSTIGAIVDHITDILPTADEEHRYCPPLAQHYPKILSSIFEQPSNVERLKNSIWFTVVDFCLLGINQYLDDHNDAGHSSSTRSFSGQGTFRLSGSTARSAGSNGASQSRSSSISRQNVEDLLQILHLLVHPSKAPIAERYHEVMDTAVRFLQIQVSSVGLMHQFAFSIVNAILSYTCNDQIVYSQSVARDLVPVILRFWQGKAIAKDEMLNSVRDEMLIFIYTVCPHLERSVMDDKSCELLTTLESLSDTFLTDYTKRSDRDQLQLDDLEMLDLGAKSINISPFSLQDFRLRPHNTRAERNWGTLQAVGVLERLISLGRQKGKSGEKADLEDIDQHPRKRQRVAQSSDRLLGSLRMDNEHSRVSSLQALPFILQGCQLSTAVLEEYLDVLRACASDKRGNVASWALLAIASCTSQKTASEVASSHWVGVWHLGARLLTISSTCRTAALQLHCILSRNLLDYHNVIEDVNAMITAADISGPVMICDSTISLMAHLLNVRITEVPGASLATSQHIIRWLFARWKPADRDYANHDAVHVQPLCITNLIRTSLSLQCVALTSDTTLPCGPLARAWQNHNNNAAVTRYLMLLNEPDPPISTLCHSCPSHETSEDITNDLDSTHFQSIGKLILELLIPKCGELLQNWKSYGTDRLSTISPETLRSAIYSCITMLLCVAHFSTLGSPQLSDFKTSVRELYKAIVTFLNEAEARDADGTRVLLDTLHQCVQPYLPQCKTTSFSILFKKNSHLLEFFVLLAQDASRRRATLASLEDGGDPMAMDDEFSTQTSQGGTDVQKAPAPRHLLALETSASSFYLITYERLLLVLAMSSNPDSTPFIPSTFIQQFIKLSPEELFLSRGLLNEITHSDLIVDVADALHLVNRVGPIAGSGEFAHCEVALTLYLDLLEGLGLTWSIPNDANKSLAETALDFYEISYKRFEAENLEMHAVSVEVQKGLARLLFLLLERAPHFGDSRSVPSARSNLFDLLKLAPTQVKFYIGNQLSDIFRLFLLGHHDNIFIDLQEILPSDPDCIEGISFRLFALAKLASKWPTLLRRCLYALFETAGKISEAIRHTTRCLSDVSNSLKLNSAQDLFALFAPQLLYTRLEQGEDIDGIPYQIFGFSSLEDLLRNAQEEATGLMMMMRGQDDGVQQIARILRVDEDALIKICFTKVIAYAIAWDIRLPRKKKEEAKKNGQLSTWARVKERLGEEAFFGCINLHFADIIALFFSISDPQPRNLAHPQNEIEFSFKRLNLDYATDIITAIKSMSSSALELPPSQQPAFKDRFLPDQVLALCGQTEFETRDIYTPALVTFIARKLFGTIHPALGSLHACSVLRKTRALIALAGDAAIRGYPLEMLLQALRPFISDPQCAEDAIGITQYLLDSGSEYLSEVPSFVAGITLAILGSLREFLKAGRARSTQESQHQNTVSRVEEFRNWLGTYLDTRIFPVLDDLPQNASVQRLIKSAYKADWVGNAYGGTPEAELLFELLQDEQINGRFLSKPSRELALNMLCSDFQSPASFRTDMLGDDASAISNAVAVWKTCKGKTTSKGYLSWAGRIIGRAFAASGQIQPELLRESTLSEIKDLSQASERSGDSRACIFNLLQDLTLGHDKHFAGLAEAALRVVMTTSDATLKQTCRDTLADGLYIASVWDPYNAPPSESLDHLSVEPLGIPYGADAIFSKDWLRNFAVALANSIPDDILVFALVPVITEVPSFAEQAFPFILHLVLSSLHQSQHTGKKDISKSFMNWFGDSPAVDKNKLKTLINALLYLRTQPLPKETSSADRSYWLEINYLRAATAATSCGMFKTALLFAEEYCSAPVKPSRRSSINHSFEQSDMPNEMLLTIFKNIDDPDVYYGVQQKPNLKSILARFEYEKDGPKSLAFRSAQYDSHFRRRDPESSSDAQALVKALDNHGLSGLSHSLLQAQPAVGMSAESRDSMFRTARKLEQWDLPVPSSCSTNSVTIYKAFQSIQTATDHGIMLRAIDDGFDCTLNNLIGQNLGAGALHDSLQTLAALVEMDEVLSTQGSEQIEELLARFQDRSDWMKTGRFDDMNHILSCRGTTLSTLSQQPRLQTLLKVNPVDTRLVEVQTALLASRLNRAHKATQESLSLATSLTDLIGPCQKISLNIDIAVQVEAANALWDQGEMASSIGILQALDDATALKKQTIPVGRSDLLSKTGYQVSVARLEKADKIIDTYLKPALKELKGKTSGIEAGQVFHQFAVFCDQQLQDPDNIEDLERLERMAASKKDEILQCDKLLKGSISTHERARIRSQQNKARVWLKLDQEELQRHVSNSEQFLGHSLENYLLALAASDEHDSAALRFAALWLEYLDKDLANEAVSKHLKHVPSRKLAALMNQLASRLQNLDSKFQQLLRTLVLRICTDHPYHGMYVIIAGNSGKPDDKDEAAVLRYNSTVNIAKQLSTNKKAAPIWQAISQSSKYYVRLAIEEDKQLYKSGRKVNLKDSDAALRLNTAFTKYRIPPPTMPVQISADLDYSRIPLTVRLEPVFSIASGVSTPKIITVVANNGVKYKQLVKGSQDDLRQDAIMEQVFEQVSELLKTSQSTRQRNLGIRTYKVVPLNMVAGVIEFVANTIPLHEYLMPAHERYHPKDMKGNQCRREIGEVQTKSTESRVQKYRSVTERFQPVMRYFFTEHFTDPDEWFVKRLAYTRTTAAISILGHVLGLGDRHGHNILLDSQSGEVVHIDLGVAFEAGRVLPVPELVPFRLTRDIVDGMGITKTEGVFRRGCEFTLEALRKEADSIMAILDVLRYDPLHSWSVSPTRVAKLQEGQSAAPKINQEAKEAVNEPGEATRVLTVVSKKLSESLSVTATVNDLINQASDERNLAVLYSGWAAYA